MTGHSQARIVIGTLLGVWLLTLGTAVWQARRASLAESSLSAASKQIDNLRRAAAHTPAPVAPSGPSISTNPRDERAATAAREAQLRSLIADRDAQIETLQNQVNEARAESSRLRLRVNGFDEEQRKASDAANERYSAAVADWQSRLDSLNQQLETAQSAAEAARARTKAVEASLNKQTSDQAEAQTKFAEARRLLASLQDLNRRRETYLDSVLRRYRDVLSQLRTIGNLLDSSRDQNSSPVANAALARIESTITLAEDDMRQLSDVSHRAAQAEKRLSQLQ